MDQQATEDGKPKISRSKARHLRRKRLIAARRIAENNTLHIQCDSEPNSDLQKPDKTLSKSKARRLRKKEKAESIHGPSQVQKTEKRAANCENPSPIIILESNKFQSSTGEIFAPGNVLTSVAKEESLNSDISGAFNAITRQKETLSIYQQNSKLNIVPISKSSISVGVDSERQSLVCNDALKSIPQRDFQLQLNLDAQLPPQGTIDFIGQRDLEFNHNRDSNDSPFKAEFYESFLGSDALNSKAFDSNQSLSESQLLHHDHNRDFELMRSSRIANISSNELSRNNDRVREKDDKGVKRRERSKTTSSFLSKTDVTSDDDLDSPDSISSSNFIEQYELNTIQGRDSSGVITRQEKTVLNTTELIENEKNLKISSCSNSHSLFQPNAAVIDLTSYSNSDLIINTDSTSCQLDEQQIIVDFISDSDSGLVQNNTFFYTDSLGLSNIVSKNQNKTHNNAVSENFLNSENQAPFDLIKDYSLPSTSVNEPLETSQIQHFKQFESNRNYDSSKADGKMSSTEKTREQVKAEREAKKAAKALAKSKAKTPKSEENIEAKSSKDAPTKSSGPDQVPKGVKQDAKKSVIPPEEKAIAVKTETVGNADNKENESQSKVDGKSKRESKAERRAKQEAQRAAKEKLLAEKNKPKSAVPAKAKIAAKESEPVKMIVRKTLVDNNLHEVKLFKHLYHERELSLVNFPTLNSHIHPAIVRLGVQYANKVIVGSNARCVALLAAVKQLVEDFERPSQADFTRGLEASLQECAAYLHHCRPMAVSMQNAMKHLKWQMSQLPTTVSDEDAKSKLAEAIDTYIREQILLAGKAISNTIQTKISNGDVILTYAFSSLIHNILIDAHNAGKQFRVIVVDGRPWLEGKELLRRLSKHGIECSYILINALSFIMPEVSKVFLGAHAILANGAVMSRAGTAQVALMAKAFNVPVLVACETHKSCERVQTDSFVYNEIGDADQLASNLFSKSKKSLLINWKTKKSLDLLNITFDVTPADLVSAVVTELAILPCTSIPVILRIKPSEI